MKIACYSLTRDRLWATKPCFASLREHAGVEFSHVVVDNGSTDGTTEWLKSDYRPSRLIASPINLGISKASNMALAAIFQDTPDVEMIVKVDNDCLVKSAGILWSLIRVFEELMPTTFAARWILSPRVEGIVRQPRRSSSFWTKDYEIGKTSIVGGLFHVVPAAVYQGYRYPESLPLAAGQDDHFCSWARGSGCEIGYVENLTVEHYLSTDEQAKQDPAYFTRKWREEKEVVVWK